MKYKKSMAAFEMMMWFLKILFIVGVLFAVVILIRSFVITTVDVSELQANVFVYRMLYSPNSFSYLNSGLGRVYPGIIDFERFKSQANEKFLENAAFYGNNNREIGAGFYLKNLVDGEENTVYYNKDFFREQKILVDSGFTEGPGGARGYAKEYNILIKKNNTLEKGVLKLEVIIPNS